MGRGKALTAAIRSSVLAAFAVVKGATKQAKYKNVSQQLGISVSSVKRGLRLHGGTKKLGRPATFSSPSGTKKIVDTLTKLRKTRKKSTVTRKDIIRSLKKKPCEKTVSTVLKSAGYNSRLTTKKILLTEQHIAARYCGPCFLFLLLFSVFAPVSVHVPVSVPVCG